MVESTHISCYIDQCGQFTDACNPPGRKKYLASVGLCQYITVILIVSTETTVSQLSKEVKHLIIGQTVASKAGAVQFQANLEIGTVNDNIKHVCISKQQKQLGQSQRRFQQRIQEREKELQELRKAVETLKVRR